MALLSLTYTAHASQIDLPIDYHYQQSLTCFIMAHVVSDLHLARELNHALSVYRYRISYFGNKKFEDLEKTNVFLYTKTDLSI